MKRLISLSGLGLVKGGAVSGAENRRALRNNDKEISLEYKRPQMNACKESHNSNMNNNFLLDNDNAKVMNKESCEYIFDEKAYLFIWPWSGQRRGSIGGRKPEGIKK